MPALPVVRDPDYTVAIEYEDGRCWVHNEVHRYSHAVRKRLLRDLEKLHERFGDLWCLKGPLPVPKLFDKYVTGMGFRSVGIEANGDGDPCLAYFKAKNGQFQNQN